MTQKKYLKLLLILGLYVVALGGFGLHYRIHHPADNPANYVPLILGIMSIVIIPTLFFFKKIVPYAYVLNGITVIIGTITMAHLSMKFLPNPITFQAILFGGLLADILLLWTKFFIGKAIFDLEITNNLEAARPKGRFLRYPNVGYWLVHLVAMSFVYYLGYMLWK